MVPAERVEEAKSEAEHLPFVEISKLDLQWLQVFVLCTEVVIKKLNR